MRLPIPLLTTIALVLALLPQSLATAQDALAPRIAPEVTANESVQRGDWVIIDGEAPSGGSVSAAALVGLRSGQEVSRQPITTLNSPPPNDQTSFVRIQGSTLDGRAQLGCRFAPAVPSCGMHQTPDAVVLEVIVDGITARSPSVPVDFTAPRILRFDVTGPNQIVVVFSERVRLEGNGTIFPADDSAVDWSVTDPNTTVFSVGERAGDCPDGRSGCTRVLTTSTIAEDETPVVFYNPPLNRPVYTDFGGNIVRREDGAGNRTRAIDRVIPAKPQIDQVAGRTPSQGRVAWREPSPVLSLSNLNPDADGQTLSIEVDGEEVAEGIAITGSSQQVTVPDLGTDDVGITITVVAIDRSGNRSDSSEGSPSRAHGSPNPVTYDLDTAAPFPISVDAASATELRVGFIESITPAGSAGRFTLTGTDTVPQQVEGTGAMRTLRFAAPVPAGARLSWEPTAGAGGPVGGGGASTYRDRVELELQWPAAGLPILVLPPPGIPAIAVPSARTVVAENRIDVSGTARAGTVVDLFRDEDLSDPVATGIPVQDGRWTASGVAPGTGTPPDGEYTLRAVARDPERGISSAAVTSAPIVVDTIDPVIDVTEPSAPPLLGSNPSRGRGSVIEVEWTAEDANPSRFALDLLRDGEPLSATCTKPAWTTSGTFRGDCEVPLDFSGGEVVARVIGTDLAGRTGTDTSFPVEIAADLLAPAAALVSNNGVDNRIGLTYPVPLSGFTFGPTDWRANDGRAQGAPNRPSTAASQSGPDVQLRFAAPFPGPATGHPNARPRYAYGNLVLGDTIPGLRGPDDERIEATGRVRDIVPPALTVAPVDPGPFNGCPVQPDGVRRCVAAGPAVQIGGGTDTGFDYDGDGIPDVNAVEVFAGSLTTAQAASAPRVAIGTVAADGSFDATVPLRANAEQTFTVLATDIHGLQGSPFTFTVTEDSDPPGFRRLLATLGAGDANRRPVTVDFEADEPVTQIVFQRAVADGGFVTLQTVSSDSGSFTFSALADDLTRGITLRAIATDLAGNVGTTDRGISAAAELVRAIATSPRTVEVEVSEPVEVTTPGSAGFSILEGGPGIASVEAGTNDRGLPIVTLTTRVDLPRTDPLIRYVDRGDIRLVGGGRLQSGQVRAERGFVFPIRDCSDGILAGCLVAGPTADGGVNVSWSDDRNADIDVAAYQISRAGEVVGEVGPGSQRFTESGVGDGTHTYTVVVVDDEGRISAPARATVVLGGGPDLPGGAGGTGFPPASEILEDCVFTGAPNVTPAAGGAAVSCDGQAVVIVPPGAVAEDHFAKIVRRRTVPTPGFSTVMDLYQLVAVSADGLVELDALDQLAEFAFRPDGDLILDRAAERTTTLRLYADGQLDELSSRVLGRSAATQILTPGTFAVVETAGSALQVFGPDPALPTDRFATAAGLSQTINIAAGAAVIARADDYPDALAASALAAQIGGPILLANPDLVPRATLLELRRLGVDEVVLVGGVAALGEVVADTLASQGLTVRRIEGPTRFETAAAVADEVGAFGNRAFLAVGTNFADALAASGPAASLSRPILLTLTDEVPETTLRAMAQLGVIDVTILGGTAAVSEGVADVLRTAGFEIDRAGGEDRYATAVVLADLLIGDGAIGATRPVLASGVGDGRTSPDALSAGPIAARYSSPLLLSQRDVLSPAAEAILARRNGIRGVVMSGGPLALTPAVREGIDAAVVR